MADSGFRMYSRAPEWRGTITSSLSPGLQPRDKREEETKASNLGRLFH
jgi:hypothetical protein